MQMPKSPPALIERFDTVAADFPEATRRLTFGYPCLYVGGNMATGLFGDAWHVRVSKDDTDELIRLPGARPADDRVHAAAGDDRRRRRRDPRVGGTGDRARLDDARQDAEAQDDEAEAGEAKVVAPACRFAVGSFVVWV